MMKRRWLMFFAALLMIISAVISCRQAEKKAVPDLEEMTISRLQQGYKEGRFTVKEVVEYYLRRIDSLDDQGPALNAVLVVNPDALAIAEELDKELKEGRARGPMHGVPVILKDNIDTKDRMPTTAGSAALRNSFARQDAWLVKMLRDAGAVILAKANLSEWANFRANFSSSGWSGVGGQTKNPYVLDRNPCGSSSGPGVAVAANLCMVAIGTETNGSVVCPSNNNGIVGLKPTVGLVSRSGVIPISFSQDTPGPMGRSVEDVAICLGAMTSADARDSKTFASEGKSLSDYSPFLKAGGLKGKRIGLLKTSTGFHFKVDELLQQAMEDIKRLGGEVIEIGMPGGKAYEDASFQVMLYEFKDGLNKYLAGLGPDAPVKDLTELIAFNKKDTVELQYFDQALLEMAHTKGGLDAPEYREALEKMHNATRAEGIDKVMNDNQLDAIMAPTGTPAWKTDLVNGDLYLGGSSSLAAIAGYPNIAVPMGFVGELPVDVSFFGRAWSEPVLIEIAYAFEQGTKHRKPPKFLKE